MNVLYLADLNSVHDIKWITYFKEKGYGCYVIQRKEHYKRYIESQNKISGVKIEGEISDYSTLRFWKNGTQISKLKDIIQSNRIDIFHIMYAEPNVLWTIIKKSINVKVVLTTRGTDILKTIPLAMGSKSILNHFVSKKYKRAFDLVDFTTSTSHSQKDRVRQLFGKNVAISIIRTGIDIQKMDDRIADINIVDTPFILFPRKMKPIYNHEFSVRSLGYLPKSIKNRYKMVFIDKNGLDKEYIASIMKLMNDNPDLDFVFLEEQNEDSLKSLYESASLIVMNPHSDGSSVTAIEAMYFNKPLILGPIDYDPELFKDVPKISKWDEVAMARAIEGELNKPTFYDGLNVVSKFANRQIEMEKLDSIYRSLFN